MLPVVFPALALIGAIIELFVQKRERSSARVLEVLARWLIVVAIGATGIFALLGHTLAAKQVAEQIGFPPDNPFQWEVAWANAAVGVLGILCLWRRDFWWPTAIGAAIYLWGCAWGHIYQLVAHDNHEPSNAGAILYMDIPFPWWC
jgi:hypothetical protein